MGAGSSGFEMNNILIIGSKDTVHLGISKYIFNPS